MSGDHKRWPIEPIQRIVESQTKGLQALAVARGATMREAEKLNDTYRRGVREGFLTLPAMDAICCDGLGLHPLQVFGDLYLDESMDGPIHKKPCPRCQDDSSPRAPRQKLCIACKEQEKYCACGCGELTPTEKARYVNKSHAAAHRRARQVAA